MDIGDKIRLKREELGLSQAEVARAVSISQAAIDKIENGKTRRSKFLPQILAKLDLPQALLFEGSAVTPSPETKGPGDTLLNNELRQVGPTKLIPIKVSGRAKAGEWLAVDDLGDWDEPEIIYGQRDERFPDARLLAFALMATA